MLNTATDPAAVPQVAADTPARETGVVEPQRVRPPYADTKPVRPGEARGFTDAIAHGWGSRRIEPSLPLGAAAAAEQHRSRLSERLTGHDLVVCSGEAPRRNGDAAYGFRADSDFVWLTGCQVEGAVLVLRASGSRHDATLFLPAPAGPGEPDFFGSALHGELWVGASPGLRDWAEALSVGVKNVTELPATLDGCRGALTTPTTPSAWVATHGLEVDGSLSSRLSDLRMVKDDWEIGQLRQAVDHTVTGFAAVMAEVPAAVDGLGERWLQGTFDRHARTFGNGPGYASIVGSGPHAPTLHWVRCDGPVLADSPLLLDMGVEATSLYTADVTRTVPPSGSFSPVQREVHDIVERAHRAGMDQVRPGVQYSDFHFASMEVVASGLNDMGLLGVSVDEALSPQGQQHRRYLVCGIGHHLGLDVHDCLSSDHDRYQGARLEPGMVMTVEPGLYFHAHDETVPPELRGIGVRLEDDLLVTPTGAEVLSDALPIDAAGIERWAQRHLAAASGA
ncbi:aminopeptidase P family protein [Humibacillus sp. DSM 29435]|uniref:aminopeptidase P family protein n=1 Tax=Humibacillus sp. DSM 29435 TaxID=1869167 RepID=UPI0009F4A713|nr:aminopeptidase P family protein [Humibacillus sp. DSM 29435]